MVICACHRLYNTPQQVHLVACAFKNSLHFHATSLELLSSKHQPHIHQAGHQDTATLQLAHSRTSQRFLLLLCSMTLRLPP